MEYIFIIIAMFICSICILALFAETEILKSTVIYEKGKFLKIIKCRNGRAVRRKVYKGWIADFIYRFFV